MRILHVIPSYWPAVRYGGPIKAVRELCYHLRQAGVDIRVATTNADGPTDLPVTTSNWSEVDGVPVRYFARCPKTRFTISMQLASFLQASIADFDLIHVTSLFSFPSLVADRLAARNRIPYVVSPRGSLLPAARRWKRWKKLLYWWLLERRNLLMASAIHATSDQEAAAIQSVIHNGKVVVIPNGVRISERPPNVNRNKRRLVFLGRIHPIKGFDLLIPSLARLARLVPDLETVVAGPNEEGYCKKVAAMIHHQSPRPNVLLQGPIPEEGIREFLAGAALMVLPSQSENFGQVVLEALAVGTPVVAAQTTPWQVLEETGAGRWLPRDPDVWAQAIATIILDEERHRHMSAAAVALARTFSWESIAQRMVEVYKCIIARRPLNDC